MPLALGHADPGHGGPAGAGRPKRGPRRPASVRRGALDDRNPAGARTGGGDDRACGRARPSSGAVGTRTWPARTTEGRRGTPELTGARSLRCGSGPRPRGTEPARRHRRRLPRGARTEIRARPDAPRIPGHPGDLRRARRFPDLRTRLESARILARSSRPRCTEPPGPFGLGDGEGGGRCTGPGEEILAPVASASGPMAAAGAPLAVDPAGEEQPIGVPCGPEALSSLTPPGDSRRPGRTCRLAERPERFFRKSVCRLSFFACCYGFSRIFGSITNFHTRGS